MKTEQSKIVSSTTTKKSEEAKVEESPICPAEKKAKDKENIVGVTRVLRSKSGPLKIVSKEEMSGQVKKDTTPKNTTTKEKTTKKTEVKKQKKTPPKKVSPKSVNSVKSANSRGKIKIKVDDLTSQERPSENYYKILAEKRRVALENALEENEDLHHKIRNLEKENKSYKEMLDASNALVEVLQEMIGEDNPDINNSLDDSVL